jgi:glycosyltransferase involved in cell wall biosynthesis
VKHRRSVAGLRVAIVNWRDPWHPEAGGAETYAWEMALGLLRRGAQITYVTARADGQTAAESRDGIQIVRLGARFTVYPLVLAWLLRRRRSFDAVVDCQNGIPFFTPWALPRRVPVFCVMHHVHDAQFGVHFSPAMAAVGRLLEGPVARVAYRRHLSIAVSQSTERAMADRLGWKGPVCIIPNGLSGSAFDRPPEEPATRLPAPAPPATVTWVGRMVAHKRVDRVLDVAARLGPAGHVIDVIGRGPSGAELAERVASSGLADVVRLRGYLPEESKRAAVAASALHLNTSQGEGWGLCVLEAAALGVPTVAYDVDGLRDAVRHGVTGWLVEPGERIEDLVERALGELEHPARRAEIAAACRSWAAQFDWDASAGQLAALIGAAVSRDGVSDDTVRDDTVPDGTAAARHVGDVRAPALNADRKAES